MFEFILKRIIYGFLVLYGVVTIVFFLFYVLPGDPARMMLDQREDTEQIAIIRSNYGLDLPVYQQYLFYLNDLSPISIYSNDSSSFNYFENKSSSYIRLLKAQKNNIIIKIPYLRKSFVQKGINVSNIISDVLLNTMILAITAILLAFLLGMGLGLICAVYKDTLLDKIFSVVSALGMSFPSFFSAILIAWIFGYLLEDFTGLNMTGNLYLIDDFGEREYIEWKNLILPSLTLAIRPLAVITQLVRNSLIDVLKMDFIRTATAKGLSFKVVLLKHALKNALTPVITASSGWLGSMLAGAVFVEYVFGWNGIGRLVVYSLNQMDLPVVMGCVIVIATIFVVINILVDLIYAYLNPKIRLS